MADSTVRRNEVILTDAQVVSIARVAASLRTVGFASKADIREYDALLDLITARADDLMHEARAGRRHLRAVE